MIVVRFRRRAGYTVQLQHRSITKGNTMHFEDINAAVRAEGRRAYLQVTGGWEVTVRLLKARQAYGVIRFDVEHDTHRGPMRATVDAARLTPIVEG